MRRGFLILLQFLVFVHVTFSQRGSGDEIDTSAIRKMWNEGTDRSQVMNILGYLTDVCGPRLTGSPQYTKAAQWAMSKMSEWGVANPHLEGWGPFGKSWTLEHYSGHVTQPDVFPLISFPKAWSSGTKGSVNGEAILFDAKTDSALATYKGKLKGKFILLDEPRTVKPQFEPRATRENDTTLLEQANADFPRARRARFGVAASPDAKKAAMFAYNKTKMMYDEGVLATLTVSRGDGGNIFVQQASVLSHPDTPRARRPQA